MVPAQLRKPDPFHSEPPLFGGSAPSAVLGDIERVRKSGEEHGHPVLPRPGFDYDPELVAEARMVTASVLDADLLWTEPADGMQLHFAVHDVALAAGGQ